MTKIDVTASMRMAIELYMYITLKILSENITSVRFACWGLRVAYNNADKSTTENISFNNPLWKKCTDIVHCNNFKSLVEAFKDYYIEE